MGSYIDLSIRVKDSTGKYRDNKPDIWYKAVKYLTIFFLFPVFALLVRIMFKINPDFLVLLEITWLTPLFFVTVGLSMTSLFLIYRMHKYFSPKLNDRKRRAITVFLVYLLANVSRLVDHFLEGSTSSWKLVLYNLWDVVPLMTLMIFHRV